MASVTRRAVVGGLAASVAAPAVVRAARPDFDVIVVGAGAAGIAAARRLGRAGRSFAVLEASDRFGGRCFTDTQTFARPYDRGAQWVHETEAFPVTRLAAEASVTIDKAGLDPQLRVPGYPDRRTQVKFRAAREHEIEEFYTNLVRCDRAIAAAATSEEDISAADVLPPEILDWRATMEFLLGPFITGSDLDTMPAREYAQFQRPDTSLRFREGVGMLLRRLALGLPVQFFSPVTRIDWGASPIEVEARDRKMTATAVILTAPPPVLAAGRIAFRPALPARVAEALARLKPGSVERVAVEVAEAAQLPSDKLVIEKAVGRRTAAAHVNFLGSPLSFVQVGGRTCAELVRHGDAALATFATDWLVAHFGADLRRHIRRTHVTRWREAPFALGAFSCAVAGGGAARKLLAQPLGGRLFFAGEAVHESLWGTVAGAWETGERAATALVQAGLVTGAR